MKQLTFLILLLSSFTLQAEQVNATLGWAQIATLSTPLNGRVASVKVNVGDVVKKGQLLAALDSRLLKAELRRTEAILQSGTSNYEEEKRELERGEELFERTVLSQTELQRVQLSHSLAEAEYRRAEADVEVAQLNLEYSKIHAPFNGTIVERNVHPGEVVANQFQVTPMLRIARGDQLIATAVVTAEQAARLNSGDKVTVSVNGASFDGKVMQIRSGDGAGLVLKVVFKSDGKVAGWGMATLDF